jgi:hypothetical protein
MKQYVIGVFEEKRDYLYKEYYKCEHMGILHTEKELNKATIVEDYYKPWMDNVCEYLNKHYPDLLFCVLVLNGEPNPNECDATEAPTEYTKS